MKKSSVVSYARGMVIVDLLLTVATFMGIHYFGTVGGVIPALIAVAHYLAASHHLDKLEAEND